MYDATNYIHIRTFLGNLRRNTFLSRDNVCKQS